MTHEIAGVRTRIDDPETVLRRARKWASEHGVEVLLADARAVFGRDHATSAVLHAERAQGSGAMTARSLATETLRYLSGRRQVADAIRVAGIRKGSVGVLAVVFGIASGDPFLAEMGWTRDDGVLEAKGKDLRTLGLTRQEESTVPAERRPDLALERVALLDVVK